MVLPEGIDEISKLTNPRVMRFTFLPARISIVVFPPPLLDWKPSRVADADSVIDWIFGVGVTVGLGVGVAVGFLVGVGLLSGSLLGVGVEVTEAVGVGVG